MFCCIHASTRPRKITRRRICRTLCSSGCLIYFPLSLSAAAGIHIISPISQCFAGKGWLMMLVMCLFYPCHACVLTCCFTGHQAKHKQKRAMAFFGCSLCCASVCLCLACVTFFEKWKKAATSPGQSVLFLSHIML